MATSLTFEFLSPRSYKVISSTTEPDKVSNIIIKPASVLQANRDGYSITSSGNLLAAVAKVASTGEYLGTVSLYYFTAGDGEATVIYPEGVVIEQLAYITPNAANITPYTNLFRQGDYTGADAVFDSLDVPKITPSFAQPLATPTGLSADQITSNSARIGWNAVANATDYKVEYRRQGDTTWNE